MDFNENNYEPLPTEGDELPEESNNNRTFMIAVGILGGLILISVACLGGVYLFGNNSANTAEVAAVAAGATQTEIANRIQMQQALTATAQALQPTATLSPTPTATPPVALPSPTGTPDVVLTTAAGGEAPGAPVINMTATLAAANMTVAAAQTTSAVYPSPTRLAGTGIADEYGLPGLVVMALAFVIVILFARRLRTSPSAR